MLKIFHSSKTGLQNSKALPTSPFRFILPKSGQMPKIFETLKGSKHSLRIQSTSICSKDRKKKDYLEKNTVRFEGKKNCHNSTTAAFCLNMMRSISLQNFRNAGLLQVSTVSNLELSILLILRIRTSGSDKPKHTCCFRT